MSTENKISFINELSGEIDNKDETVDLNADIFDIISDINTEEEENIRKDVMSYKI